MDPVADWVARYRRATSREPTAGLEYRVRTRLGSGTGQARWLVPEPLLAIGVALLALVIGILTPVVLAPPAVRGVQLSILAVDAPLLPSTVLGRYRRES